jgi:predicted phage tail protein
MTEERIIIRGAGKPPSPRDPIEAPDSLSSTQYARVLDLVSEGEIDQYETVYLDKTALTNFSGYVREFRLGTQNQSAILVETGVLESTTSVGVTVTQSGGPITRTVTNTDIDRVAITV